MRTGSGVMAKGKAKAVMPAYLWAEAVYLALTTALSMAVFVLYLGASLAASVVAYLATCGGVVFFPLAEKARRREPSFEMAVAEAVVAVALVVLGYAGTISKAVFVAAMLPLLFGMLYYLVWDMSHNTSE